MSQDNYRHAFSHILVAGTTLWCIYNTSRNLGSWRWVHISYGSLCFYSFVGIWRYGNPQYGDNVAKIYDTASKILMAFALPCVITELYINYGYEFYIALIHSAIPLIPVSMLLINDEWEQDLVDCIILGNVVSGFVLSVLQDNYFGIAGTFNYFINHFIMRNRTVGEVPPKVFYNVGLCFFMYYAYKALAETIVINVS